jgi:hypothetical protein
MIGLVVWFQTTEPADYSAPVGDLVSEAAATAWPIVLAVIASVVAISVAVYAIRAGFRRMVSLVGVADEGRRYYGPGDDDWDY